MALMRTDLTGAVDCRRYPSLGKCSSEPAVTCIVTVSPSPAPSNYRGEQQATGYIIQPVERCLNRLPGRVKLPGTRVYLGMGVVVEELRKRGL